MTPKPESPTFSSSKAAQENNKRQPGKGTEEPRGGPSLGRKSLSREETKRPLETFVAKKNETDAMSEARFERTLLFFGLTSLEEKLLIL